MQFISTNMQHPSSSHRQSAAASEPYQKHPRCCLQNDWNDKGCSCFPAAVLNATQLDKGNGPDQHSSLMLHAQSMHGRSVSLTDTDFSPGAREMKAIIEKRKRT